MESRCPLSWGHDAILRVLWCLGEFIEAETHVDELGRLLASPSPSGIPLRQTSAAHLFHSYGPLIFAVRGDTQRALDIAAEAEAAIRSLSNPFDQATSLVYIAWMHQLLRNDTECLRYAEQAIALTRERRFPFYEAAALVFRGWVGARNSSPGRHLAELREGIATWRNLGTEIVLPNFLVLEAECVLANDTEAALGTLAAGLAQADRTGEHCYDAENHRVQAVALAARGRSVESAAALKRGLDIARKQGASLWEARLLAS